MSRIPDEIQLYRIRESWRRDCCGDDDGGAKGNVVVVDRDAGLGGGGFRESGGGLNCGERSSGRRACSAREIESR